MLLIAHIIPPVPFHAGIIGVEDHSLALALIEPEIALEDCAVLPPVFPATVLEPALPVALVDVAVHEDHLPEAVLLPQPEVAGVVVAGLVGVGPLARPAALRGLALVLVPVGEAHEGLHQLVLAEDPPHHLAAAVGDHALAAGRAVGELALEGEQGVLEDAGAVRAAVGELSLVGGVVVELEVPLAVLGPAPPLALVEVGALLGPVPVDEIVLPGALVDASVEVVEDPLSVLFPVTHLSLVAFAVAGDENALAGGGVVLPLPEVDVAAGGLEDTGAVFAVVSELALVGLAGGVLDLLDVLQELPVGPVDVVLQEGLDDALLLLLQPRRVDRTVLDRHNEYRFEDQLQLQDQNPISQENLQNRPRRCIIALLNSVFSPPPKLSFHSLYSRVRSCNILKPRCNNTAIEDADPVHQRAPQDGVGASPFLELPQQREGGPEGDGLLRQRGERDGPRVRRAGRLHLRRDHLPHGGARAAEIRLAGVHLRRRQPQRRPLVRTHDRRHAHRPQEHRLRQEALLQRLRPLRSLLLPQHQVRQALHHRHARPQVLTETARLRLLRRLGGPLLQGEAGLQQRDQGGLIEPSLRGPECERGGERDRPLFEVRLRGLQLEVGQQGAGQHQRPLRLLLEEQGLLHAAGGFAGEGGGPLRDRARLAAGLHLPRAALDAGPLRAVPAVAAELAGGAGGAGDGGGGAREPLLPVHRLREQARVPPHHQQLHRLPPQAHQAPAPPPQLQVQVLHHRVREAGRALQRQVRDAGRAVPARGAAEEGDEPRPQSDDLPREAGRDGDPQLRPARTIEAELLAQVQGGAQGQVGRKA